MVATTCLAKDIASDRAEFFAVVASEVRNLAQRSATAAKEIKELIVDSVDKVRAGTALVDESGQMLTEIRDAVNKVSGIVAEIAAASEEQSTGIEQLLLILNSTLSSSLSI
jgi:methyl-accepting chemotaxis protein